MRACVCLCLLAAGVGLAQTLDNHALSGKYFFRHVSISTDASETITGIRSLAGSMAFNGAGNYSFTGQQTIAAAAAAPLGGSGTYSVAASGAVTLTNPQFSVSTLNGRFGIVSAGEGMLVGSTTEGAGNTFDLFVAVQAPVIPVSNATLRAAYFVVALEFPNASANTVHGGFFKLQPGGNGLFSDISVYGHTAVSGNGTPFTQPVTGASYALTSDGSGIGIFPAPSQATPLLNGNKNLYLSARAGVILGASRDPGVHDILVGVSALAGSSTSTSWAGTFWSAGLRFETGGAASSFTGSANAIGALSRVTLTRRIRQLQPAGAATYDFTGVNDYSLQADASGVSGLAQIAVGAGGNGFVGASVSPSDPTAYEVYLGLRMPALSGTGVFLNPQGVLNGASFAPPGAPIAPGELVSLFGSGLASQSLAASPPYPFSLGGVSVSINNRPAALQYVSATQINALVPDATSAPATIVANNNGIPSNAVLAPVAPTAPGIFTLSANGVGDGAILRADSSLVSAANPAHPGETVTIYLTGLGAVDSSGAAATPVDVFVGGQQATVSSVSVAAGFPGVYQITAMVPATLAVSTAGAYPLAVRTAASFHDQVDIQLAP